MVLLARPHILATMRDSWLSGRTFIIAFSSAIIVASVSVSAIFVYELVVELTSNT
jgi:hypothetical protein